MRCVKLSWNKIDFVLNRICYIMKIDVFSKGVLFHTQVYLALNPFGDVIPLKRKKRKGNCEKGYGSRGMDGTGTIS